MRSHSTSIFTPVGASSRARVTALRDVAVERGEVVVLDQHAGREIHAVVRAAAGAHGVLLERAPAGRRLPRVEDLRLRALHRVDVARRERRDARQALHEVQRDALGRQQRRARDR